ncbi:MAG: carbamate kinase [Tenericutes bacterium]|nr:carbamate kinase [Mycoplasmatota bacterium]MDD7629464.1 carbamate kinase [bacterium]MDY4108073.1 carbamate kinase [Bacilli bacterium]
MSKIVIALGGNALGKTPFEQLELLTNVSKIIVKLVSDGNEVVLTHGNGPQVGQIVLAMDYAANGDAKTPDMPFAECGSMSQGYIGYQMQQSIQNELKRVGLQKDCVSLITQVLVDENDNAFSNPTKPIGMFYTKEQALEIEKEKGYQFVEDSGRGFRRVVPSPIPKAIIEKNVISELLLKGNIVIAVGGGGIPVINTKKGLKGIAAVIDKDRSAALLAKEIDADILLILTAVDKVCLNYNTDHVRELDSLTIDEAYKYIEENQFAKGSMLPKIEACIEFVKDNNKMAIISSLEKASDAINNKNGTVITRR